MSTDSRRARWVERVRLRLVRRGHPFGQMFLILLLTGLAGFLASVVLRRIGLANSMGLRYFLAVAIAYGAFLGMLGIWLTIARPRRLESGSRGNVDQADVVDAVLMTAQVVAPGPDSPLDGAAEAEAGTDASSGGSRSGIGKIGDAGDGKGALLVVVLLIVVAILAALFACVWILTEAPVLLAELLVDGALVAGLARRLRSGAADQHWTITAVRRTARPFLITAVAFAFVGFFLQYFVPDATTMLEALQLAAR